MYRVALPGLLLNKPLDPGILTEIRHPVPAVYALHTDHDVAQISLKQVIKFFRIGGYFLMQTGIARLVEDANLK